MANAASEADINEMARSWFGYGRWEAPFWFVGPEPGMHDDEEGSLVKRCAAWNEVGRGEVVDCRKHHLAMGITDWHRHPRPRLQSTWRRLIKLLLRFHRRDDSTEAIRLYQRDRFGFGDGETCVIELSSLAAKNLSVERDRALHRSERIRTIRYRIEQYRPEFVVFYGKDTLSQMSWNDIVGCTVAIGRLYKILDTKALLVSHPQDHVSDEAWLSNAKSLLI